MADLIDRQSAIDALCAVCGKACDKSEFVYNAPQDEQVILCPEHYCLCTLPSAQQERLTDDDFETIRIHLNAYKEKLCNQQRWEEAKEYQRIIDRFMTFASTQPEREKGRWIDIDTETYTWKIRCDQCGHERSMLSTGQTYPRFCENCGADMRGE